MDWATADGSGTAGAVAGSDYTQASGALSFPAGTTSRTVTVAVLNDALDEDDETFTVTLSSPQNATISDGSATGTIVDDDDTPGVVPGTGLSVADASAGESTSVIRFEVTLGAASGKEISVDWTTDLAGGTAAANGDFHAASGALTFQPGQTQRSFEVGLISDSLDESNETFTVTLSNAVNAVLEDDKATGTILDDDLNVSFGAGAYPVTEGASVTVTVALSSAAAQALTVPLVATAGAGVDSSDYSGVPADVAFGVGDTEATFTFTAATDTAAETGETVTLSFGTLPAGVSARSPDEAVVTITDGATAGVTVAPTAVSAAEGGATASYTVVLNTQPAGTVTVTVNGAGDDLMLSSSSLTFTDTTWNHGADGDGDRGGRRTRREGRGGGDADPRGERLRHR